jgi:hypothetical protein
MAEADTPVRYATAPLAEKTPAARKTWKSPRVIRGTMAHAQTGIDSFPDDADTDLVANNYS